MQNYQVVTFITKMQHFLHSVAVIGMEVLALTGSENAISPNVTVCVELINQIQLAIPLTTFVETKSGTATG